jgi:hypothetical protein
MVAPVRPPPLDVFCLEGDWSPDLRKRSSVRPLLELMEREHSVDVKAVHRNVGVSSSSCVRAEPTRRRQLHVRSGQLLAELFGAGP